MNRSMVHSQQRGPAGFATAHGWARLTFTQRTIDVPLPLKTERFKHSKRVSAQITPLGQLLVKLRKETGLTQKEMARKADIPRKWLGRWERGRAKPDQAQWSKLAAILYLPAELNLKQQ